MTGKPTILIDNAKIEINHYFQTLNANPDQSEPGSPEFHAPLKISDYSDLGFKITWLIGVCQLALITIADNEHLSKFEQEQELGGSINNIIAVLDLAKNIIPTPELELLTLLHPNN